MSLHVGRKICTPHVTQDHLNIETYGYFFKMLIVYQFSTNWIVQWLYIG